MATGGVQIIEICKDTAFCRGTIGPVHPMLNSPHHSLLRRDKVAPGAMAGLGAKISVPLQCSLPSLPGRHAILHCKSPMCSLQVISNGLHQGPMGLVILKLHLPLKDLCHLVLVEDEAGVIVAQDSHDAQVQARGVATHQI